MSKWLGPICAAAVLYTFHAGQAMTYSNFDLPNDAVMIRAVGEIVPGDDKRLRAMIADIGEGRHVYGVSLDSLGGNVIEAERLALTISEDKLVSVVPSEATCASACFLLFAAGQPRFVGVGARIGVHSVSVAGRENLDALASTTLLARDAAAYGVPPNILGKMVQTLPGQIAWLSATDLKSMGVVFMIPNSPAAPNLPQAMQYSGHYKCIQGVTDLRLRITSSGGDSVRARFSFGGSIANPGVPDGEFLMQGQINLETGTLNLQPLRWVDQPPGYTMVGLIGSSADGGSDFDGTVTGGTACSSFSIHRSQ